MICKRVSKPWKEIKNTKNIRSELGGREVRPDYAGPAPRRWHRRAEVAGVEGSASVVQGLVRAPVASASGETWRRRQAVTTSATVATVTITITSAGTGVCGCEYDDDDDEYEYECE